MTIKFKSKPVSPLWAPRPGVREGWRMTATDGQLVPFERTTPDWVQGHLEALQFAGLQSFCSYYVSPMARHPAEVTIVTSWDSALWATQKRRFAHSKYMQYVVELVLWQRRLPFFPASSQRLNDSKRAMRGKKWVRMEFNLTNALDGQEFKVEGLLKEGDK